MAKSRDAFRTISEVADWLGIQAHVLRFWESKFSQVKPIKRAGGRRYYRPADMLLLGGIKKLLHEDGLTIKGVQKILREEGMSHVAAMSGPLDSLDPPVESSATPAAPPPDPIPLPEETGVVLNFEPPTAAEPAPEAPAEEPDLEAISDLVAAEEGEEETPAADDQSATGEDEAEQPTDTPERADEAEEPLPQAELPAFLRNPMTTPAERGDLFDHAEATASAERADEAEDAPAAASADEAESSAQEPQDATLEAPEAVEVPPVAKEAPPSEEAPQEAAEDDRETGQEPALDEPEALPDDAEDNTPEAEAPADPPAPRPRNIDLPPFPSEDDIPAQPGVLAAAMRLSDLPDAQARAAAPLLARLRDALDGMRNGSLPR